MLLRLSGDIDVARVVAVITAQGSWTGPDQRDLSEWTVDDKVSEATVAR
jgi:hypothetical protein